MDGLPLASRIGLLGVLVKSVELDGRTVAPISTIQRTPDSGPCKENRRLSRPATSLATLCWPSAFPGFACSADNTLARLSLAAETLLIIMDSNINGKH